MKGFEIVAKFMHDEYEKKATEVGWNTQEKCKVEYEDLPEKNKEVMDHIAKRVMETFFISDKKITMEEKT